MLSKFKPPKNDQRYLWTQHAIEKMRHYGLSEQRVKRVIRAPKRLEEGVAPNTAAAMQPQGKGPKSLRLRSDRAGKQKWSQEIWVMWQTKNQISNLKSQKDGWSPINAGRKIKIISAWRYPGVSPVRGPIPIPQDIQEELEREGHL